MYCGGNYSYRYDDRKGGAVLAPRSRRQLSCQEERAVVESVFGGMGFLNGPAS